MTTFETRRLSVNGVTSPVLIGGTGNPGEAVVFVHGNPDTGSDWEPLMTHVAEFATVAAPTCPVSAAPTCAPTRTTHWRDTPRTWVV